MISVAFHGVFRWWGKACGMTWFFNIDNNGHIHIALRRGSITYRLHTVIATLLVCVQQKCISALFRRLKPFSHDKKKTFLAKCSQCLRNITKWASCERTVMFYMSYIPCEIFANIEKFCRSSQPTTKSYASGIFRMKHCTLLVWNDTLFFDWRPVRKRWRCIVYNWLHTVQDRPRW